MARLRSRKGRRSALIIPDAHATPDYGNARFDWLGRFAHHVDPDYIVCLGDLWDFPSLSRHDPLGSRTMEGVRVTKDLDAGHDAMDRFHQYYRRKGARLHFTMGNHDIRPDIAASQNPTLHGHLGTHQLGLKERGWEVTPYRRTLMLEGIAFSHHMTTGISGRPIGGENMSRQLIQKKHTSCVVGHSHVWTYAENTRADRQKIFGLSAGCYVHEDYAQDDNPRATWAKDTAEMWNRSVTLLEDLDGCGYADRVTRVTQRWMKRNFSS